MKPAITFFASYGRLRCALHIASLTSIMLSSSDARAQAARQGSDAGIADGRYKG